MMRKFLTRYAPTPKPNSNQYWHCLRYCSTSTETSSSNKFPTVAELFNKSLTCSKIEYKGKKIFLIGDKPSDELSLKRIEYVVNKLRPSVVCLESENPFLGRDDNQFNQKDASWRIPNPSGTLILDSYQKMHGEYYPNLASYLDNYTPDNKESHILQLRSICESIKIPIHYCGDDLPGLLLKKSRMGQLEELTIQFREEFLREAKKAKDLKDNINSMREQYPHSVGKQSQSFFGVMEGLDEKEQEEQIELTRLVVNDLTNLTKLFENDRLMTAESFGDMMRSCNNLLHIDDYELISDKSLVRNAGLNEIIRSLEMTDYQKMARDFWQAMLLLTVNRDRLLLRIIIEQCEEMLRKGQEGVLLGIFNFVHIYGMERMWKSTKFWKDEEEAREYVKEMADRERIKKDLERQNAPFFGKDDPARDTDVGDSTRF